MNIACVLAVLHLMQHGESGCWMDLAKSGWVGGMLSIESTKPNLPCHVVWEILFSYSGLTSSDKRDLKDFPARIFSNFSVFQIMRLREDMFQK